MENMFEKFCDYIYKLTPLFDKIGGFALIKEAIVTPGVYWEDAWMTDAVRVLNDKDCNEKHPHIVEECVEACLRNIENSVYAKRKIVRDIFDFYVLRFKPWIKGKYKLEAVVTNNIADVHFILLYKNTGLRKKALTISLDDLIERNPGAVKSKYTVNVIALNISKENKSNMLYTIQEDPYVLDFLSDLAMCPSVKKDVVYKDMEESRERIFRLWDKENKIMLTTADEYSHFGLESSINGIGKPEGALIGFGDFEMQRFIIMEGLRLKDGRVVYDYDIFIENEGFCTEERGVVRITGDEIELHYLNTDGEVVGKNTLSKRGLDNIIFKGNVLEGVK